MSLVWCFLLLFFLLVGLFLCFILFCFSVIVSCSSDLIKLWLIGFFVCACSLCHSSACYYIVIWRARSPRYYMYERNKDRTEKIKNSVYSLNTQNEDKRKKRNGKHLALRSNCVCICVVYFCEVIVLYYY